MATSGRSFSNGDANCGLKRNANPIIIRQKIDGGQYDLDVQHEDQQNMLKKQFKAIDEYIETFSEDTQSILQKMRQTIRKAALEAEEAIS